MMRFLAGFACALAFMVCSGAFAKDKPELISAARAQLFQAPTETAAIAAYQEYHWAFMAQRVSRPKTDERAMERHYWTLLAAMAQNDVAGQHFIEIARSFR